MASPTTDRDDLLLARDVKGPEDGPLAVLLHGGGQTRHSWRGLDEELATAGYRVTNYDARGHGDSAWSPSGDYSFDALADDLATLVAEARRPAALIGASLGGLTAMIAATRIPAAPTWAMALIDVVPRMNLEGRERILQFMAAYPDGFASLEEAAAATRDYLPHRDPGASAGTGLLKNLRRRGDRFFWHWDPAFLANRWQDLSYPPVEPLLKKASFPIALIRGGLSDIVTDVEARAFAEAVPNAEMITVPDATHMIVGDRNNAFSTAVMTFLDAHRPAGRSGNTDGAARPPLLHPEQSDERSI